MTQAVTPIGGVHSGVLVSDGTVVCQKSTGQLSQQKLVTHQPLANGRNEPPEQQKACFKQALGFNRFQYAFKLGLSIKSRELWIAMGRRCLECLDVAWAKKAYRQAPVPGMVLFLDKIQNVEDKLLLSGHVAALLSEISSAREYFLQSCHPEAALDMHCDFLQWEKALSLAQSLAPHRLPEIFLKSALQLESKVENQQAQT